MGPRIAGSLRPLDAPVGSVWEFVGMATVVYVVLEGTQTFRSRRGDPLVRRRSFSLLDAREAWFSEDSRWNKDSRRIA